MLCYATYLEILNTVDDELFEDHNNDHVVLQFLEVLVVEDVEEVRNIRVDKLEHVDLID